MPRSISSLESHLGYWVRFASNEISRAFARRIETLDVSVAEWVVLRLLYEKGAAPSALADRTGMTRGAVSKLTDKLIARKLIAQRFDTEDRRFQELSLTAAGRALVPKLAALADENDEMFFSHLAAAERKTLEKIMRGIVTRAGLKEVPVN